MYCPKCKQNFEEGSRRFCPTDGSRLVTTAAQQAAERPGGVFYHLISRIDSSSPREENPAASTRPAPNRAPDLGPMIDHPRRQEPEVFFEFADDDDDDPDDLVLDLGLSGRNTEAPASPAATPAPVPALRPGARKVSPYEIPAGHADLRAEEHLNASASEFDPGHPERFVGRVVKGRYCVTEFLGGDSGGLAYLSEDKLGTDKKVLVRIMPKGARDEAMDSILAEERVSLAHLTHPNIARLIDSGELNRGTIFLVTEFFDALSVRDVLEINGRLDEQRTARIIRQVASALSEAHQQGVMHRDLRPENIILEPGEDGSEIAKLVNFGASDGQPTPVNLSYKAPEVLDGRAATAASDIFSLGVVAYEMLTGRTPFIGDSEREVVRSQYAGLDRSITSLNPSVPRVADEIFARAFAISPQNRYPRARDLGDIFHSTLSDPRTRMGPPPSARPDPMAQPQATPPRRSARAVVDTVKLEPLHIGDEPAWTRRSPEPPQMDGSRFKLVAAVGLPLFVLIMTGAWYFLYYNPIFQQQNPVVNTSIQSGGPTAPTISSSVEAPPQPRTIPQPPNTNYYQNSKQNLKGDLLLNFVGFSLYYPKDWKVNGPQSGTTPNTRGKFLDISRETQDGRLKEQMLISYYPSKGTFQEDVDRFPLLVRETNDTLKKFLPGYQALSEGEIKVNGDWRAYEVKFQAGGKSSNGETLNVWGRRLFIPASRPGVRDGFEITMIATSLAENVHSVDDVGVKGELAAILHSFEPSQNF
jgi:eukaryotic-like serine/threonine-protein kinase